MKRTTINADEALMLEVKHQARREGRTVTAVVQDALSEYIAAHRPKRKLPEFVGMGHSGDGTLASRVDEVLAEITHPFYGWSTPPPDAEEAVESHKPDNGS